MQGPTATRGRLLLAAALTLVCLAAPAGAQAARNAEVAIMDDQLLLGAPQAEIDQAMASFKKIGVERVRVSAFWRDHAPAAGAFSKPTGFEAHDHASPGYDWETLDRVVYSARVHGLKLLVTITTPAPLWATADPARGNPVWKPSPLEFSRYAQAVATRYAPYVSMFAVLNEPNQGAWLQPQTDRRGFSSPHWYRRMLLGAYPRIKAAAPRAVVVAGELASSGRDDRGHTRPIRPLLFLREMGCRDSRFRAKRRGRCRGFRAPTLDLLGHHPYKFAGSPRRRSRERDDAAIGDASRLLKTLDRLTRRRALKAGRGRRLDVYYTEFGYQTDPPDPYSGISPRLQDRYLQESGYLAWRQRRVRGLTQFRLTDGAVRDFRGRQAYAEFQSGLLYRGHQPKRSWYSFPDPFHVVASRRRGGKTLFWGQVRPGRRHIVVLERRRGRRGGFRRVARLRTSSRGYWTRRLRARPGQYRFRWRSGRSSTVTVRR